MTEATEEVIIGEMMGPTQGVGEVMAIMQETIMTITEAVVVTTGEIITEEGVGVVMATGTVTVVMTTMRIVNSSKEMVATEEVSGMNHHHIREEVVVVVAGMEAVVVATTVGVVEVTMVVEDTLEVEVEAIKDHLVRQLAGERTSKVVEAVMKIDGVVVEITGVTRPVAAVMAAAVVDVTRASVTAVVIVAIVVASVTLRPHGHIGQQTRK